jgi:hypothetical protein
MGLEARLIKDIQHPITGAVMDYGILGLAQDTYAGPSLSLSAVSGSSATVNYFCRWSQVAQFCDAALGVSYVDLDGDSDRLFRSLPLELPIRDMKNMFAVRCGPVTGIPGMAWTGGTVGVAVDEIHLPCWRAGKNLTFQDGFVVSTSDQIEYEFALVPIEFAALPYAALHDGNVPRDEEWRRFTTVERTPRVELLNVKGGTLYWVDDPPLAQPQPVPTPDIPIRVQSVDYAVTWHQVPFAITDFDAFVGFSNSNDGFLAGHPQVPTNGFDKDRMLLLGVREVLLPHFALPVDSRRKLFQYTFYFQDRANKHNNTLRRKGEGAATTFAYNDYSFTGRVAETNAQRAIKHANLAQLFLARS